MTIELPAIESTCALAQKIAALLRPRDVVLLQGDLGAGKTTFARAALQAMGVAGDMPSPTFTLVQTYDVPVGPVFHFDLYRLKQPEEVEELGFDDACGEGIVFVEWPDKAAPYMPRETLTLRFYKRADGLRVADISATQAWAERAREIADANRG